MASITVDYLIVGAGAMGMAFADVLASDSEYTMAIVDRYDTPGGHWTISYPFVRLHGPAGIYGVDSQRMASEDRPRHAALASRHEILDYYDRFMRETLLASGRVTYLPLHDFEGATSAQQLTGRARCLVTGATTEIVVRKRIVDATYMNIAVPAAEQRNYETEPGVSVIPINQVTEITQPPERYVVVGAGKTAIDALLWLMSRQVNPSDITWIAPRDAWLLDRASQFAPGNISTLFPLKMCKSVEEIMGAMELGGFIMRRDPNSAPTAFRCATVEEAELIKLRQIDDVVQLGRVRRIGVDGMELEDGRLEFPSGTVYVDCTADGLTQRPLKPVFDGNVITLQPLHPCLLPLSAAISAKLECLDTDDTERTRLCQPVLNPNTDLDLIRFFRIRMDRILLWATSPLLGPWMRESRLATGLGEFDMIGDADVQSEVALLVAHLDDLIKMASASTA